VRSVGRNSMQAANSFMTLGKVSIIQKDFKQALDCLQQSMSIKKDLLKPRHKEIRQLELLIQGVCNIAGIDPEPDVSSHLLLA